MFRNKVRQLFDLKEIEKAKKIYLLYENEQHCQWANIGLGKIALLEEKYQRAEEVFKKLIESSPLYLSSYDWLSITYQEQYRFIFAEETLESALLLSPRSINRLKNFAKLCMHNEHFDKAVTAYESTYKLAKHSIHHSPNNAINYSHALNRIYSTIATN